MIETCGNPPVVSLSGVDKMLDAAKRGECLGISDLLEIESALTAISRMKSYLYRGRSFNIPLAYYDENIEVLDDIREAINMSIMNQAVSDNASKLLKSLRSDIEIAKDKMKAKADNTMRSNKEYYMNYQIWLLNMKRYLEMILGKWKNLILFFLKES